MAAPTTFAALGVSDEVADALASKGVTEPFPIQQTTIEAALDGRDICGKAPTGSGKTLAFGIPAVELADRADPKRPRALILSPTRELASQIKEEILPLAQVVGRSVSTVFGGTSIETDRKRLNKGVDILVACPGRLEDLIDRGWCDLSDVNIVVVDEADRMADMGFLPTVKRILDQTADDRHTLLFSATLDGEVDALIKRYCHKPLTVEVEGFEGDQGDVEHRWHRVEKTERIDTVARVVTGYYSSIVFCRTRRGCDRLAKQLRARGVEAVAIHGDRSQRQRERALAEFTSGNAQVLCATDVAARGIHVDNVALVVHYDPAGSDKDYVHRSGRTGRAGADGMVISLVVDDREKVAKSLQKDLGHPRGFSPLDIDSLPPLLDRPMPKPKVTKPEQKGSSGPKGGAKRGQRQGGKGARPGGSNSRSKQSGSKSSGSKSSGSKQGDSSKSGGKSSKDGRNDGGGGSGGRDSDAREDGRPARSRAQKGRHADKDSGRNKGKRRAPSGSGGKGGQGGGGSRSGKGGSNRNRSGGGKPGRSGGGRNSRS